MSEWKGDFLGFTYNNIHSSTLGIVRTSDGSRFNENLLPTQQTRTVQIPGRDETYYFGSDDTQRQFNVSFAFDSMTQKQLDDVRQLFGNKTIRILKFDERPDIEWKAKVTSSSIKYIPFDDYEGLKKDETEEGYNEILYKGEGSIQFTCYEPYGIKRVVITG